MCENSYRGFPRDAHIPALAARCGFLLFLALTLATTRGKAAESKTLSLNGDWKFVADPGGNVKVEDLPSLPNILPTRVPSSWQEQFVDLRDYAGVAWYWRSVTPGPVAPDEVALLKFGAVDYRAEVYVNGQKLGTHEGGYLPFEFDITSLLRQEDNQVAVRVTDPGPNREEVEGIKYAEIPHGKQNWYVQTSGLWQDVALEIRPRLHLRYAHITARSDGNFRILAKIANPPREAGSAGSHRLNVKILDPGGKLIWQEDRQLNAGQFRYEFSDRVEQASLWSLDNPALHTLRTSLDSGDVRSHRFGFRTFETRDGKFYLNGQVIYLRGALDQDYYPETIYTPPSLDYLRDEMRKAKALGLNMLRCHIKVPDPRYLKAADEVGFLVWYEIPKWDKLTDDSKRRALETFRRMVERDWNHPSVAVASIINESWGADLHDASDRKWLEKAYLEAKELVPDWLVVDNSACCQNFHMVTDVADFHKYNAIPDYAADFARFVGDMARRPRWLFSPYGDAVPRGDEPLVLSEFGNWGLPRVPEPKPWWFSRSFRGNEITLPEGVEKRFADHQYSSLFPDFNSLAEATQWHQYRALKHEINTLRSLSGIEGYVITEFTDLNWESNGLLDMWRRPKVYHEQLARLQQDDVVLARADERNWTAGEKAEAEVFVSHYSQADLAATRVVWRVEGTELQGTLDVPPLSPGSTARLGRIEFTLAAVDTPTRAILKLYLLAGDQTLAENSLDFFFYPPTQPVLPPAVSFYDPAGRLRRLVNEMRARNYQPPSGAETLPVMIASTFDKELRQALRNGSLVILLPSDRQTLAPGLEVLPRAGSRLDGNWISSFLWIRKDQEPFKGIGFETFPGFEIQSAAPITVLQGVPPQNFRDVLAGMFYGWVHSNVGVLVQAKCGKGKLLICTFSLGTTYGTDPYATYLLDALIRYAVSGFMPDFEIPLD